MWHRLIRPALFSLPPETAHHFVLKGLQAMSHFDNWNPFAFPDKGRSCTAMGLSFPNPVGLAAGFDKNGDCIEGVSALGFGFIEIGTVTPQPQPGNTLPRLFRIPESGAIINRMGFNNKGVDYLVERVSQRRSQCILGINIGKNKDTPLEKALDDYLIGFRKAYPFANYITVNLSSPNTPGLRCLQSGEFLEWLLKGLTEERKNLEQQYGRHVPIAVKIAPDVNTTELEYISDALTRFKIEGVIATNTTISREGVEDFTHGNEWGGVSGSPLLARSTQVVRQLADNLRGGGPSIIACGGVSNIHDAMTKMEAGASLIQVYTGLVYKGPQLIRELVSKM